MQHSDVKVVYVAGPYRAGTVHGIHCNIIAAERCAAALWRMGFVPLCPHKNSAYMDGVVADDVILAGDLELLRRCDAVCMFGNWKASVGARAEKARAELLNKPVWTWSSMDPLTVHDLRTMAVVVTHGSAKAGMRNAECGRGGDQGGSVAVPESQGHEGTQDTAVAHGEDPMQVRLDRAVVRG